MDKQFRLPNEKLFIVLFVHGQSCQTTNNNNNIDTKNGFTNRIEHSLTAFLRLSVSPKLVPTSHHRQLVGACSFRSDVLGEKLSSGVHSGHPEGVLWSRGQESVQDARVLPHQPRLTVCPWNLCQRAQRWFYASWFPLKGNCNV